MLNELMELIACVPFSIWCESSWKCPVLFCPVNNAPFARIETSNVKSFSSRTGWLRDSGMRSPCTQTCSQCMQCLATRTYQLKAWFVLPHMAGEGRNFICCGIRWNCSESTCCSWHIDSTNQVACCWSASDLVATPCSIPSIACS